MRQGRPKKDEVYMGGQVPVYHTVRDRLTESSRLYCFATQRFAIANLRMGTKNAKLDTGTGS